VVRRFLLIVCLVPACALAGAASLGQSAGVKASRRLMGTVADIQVYSEDPAAAERAAAHALDEMQRIDRLLSNYDPASELSAMNRDAPRGPVVVSRELFDFVAECWTYFQSTAGAFDPTVGPLVRAWGFFSPRPSKPPDAAIAAARARTGFDRVRLDPETRAVSYSVDGLEFDPGGIGKGYAVDRAVAVLRREGVDAALVSAGGSTLYAMGHPPGRDAWTVAVRNPLNVDRPYAFVRLRDGSLSTSGVSEQSVLVGSRRYSHLFDPRSGTPVDGMCQATVVAPTATASDALTKAAFILDHESIVRVLQPRSGVHAMRVEGACAPGNTVWTTPWSSSVFRPSLAP
jgi:thiamine biosynthesis lipoprotein